MVAAWLFCKVKTDRDRRRQERLAIVSRLCQQLLGHDCTGKVSVTNSAGRLPLGANVHAAAALQAVQRYQAHAAAKECLKAAATTPSSTSGPSLPFWLAPVVHAYNGCVPWDDSKADVDVAICEELKPWLMAAAGGGVSREDVANRLEFCHQMLMRHELASDTAFVEALAAVCEHLDRLSEQMAGSIRTCAVQLTRIQNLGRGFVESLLPVLLFAIGDATQTGALGHISVNSLQSSAARAQQREEEADGSNATGAAQDPFKFLWQSDLGTMLRALLHTPHCRELFFDDGAQGATCATNEYGVQDAKLPVFHEWNDAVTRYGRVSHKSGLSELFLAEHDGEARQALLELVESLDNFIKFVSLLRQYGQMADIAGDAAMFRLRMALHHLLQELEISLIKCAENNSWLSQEANRKVVQVVSTVGYFEGRGHVWVDRLRRYVDGQDTASIVKQIFDAIQELRYLSSEARLPELAQSCKASLVQLSALTNSEEFRRRCVKAPPEMDRVLTLHDEDAPLIALAEEPAEPPPARSTAASDAVVVIETWPGVSAPLDSRPASTRTAAVDLAADTAGPEQEAAGAEQLSEEPQGTSPSATPPRAAPVELGDAEELDAQAEEPPELVPSGQVHSDPAGAASSAAAPCATAPELAQAASVGTPGTESAAEAAPAQVPDDGAAAEPPSAEPPSQPSEEPPSHLGRVYASGEEERFYSLLLQSVMPLFCRDEALCLEDVEPIVLRAELPEEKTLEILRLAHNATRSPDLESVDEAMLQRVGRLVSLAQRGCVDFSKQVTDPSVHDRAPWFRGISWDGKKLRVLEPF